MTVTYATYAEFTAVYSVKGVSQTEIESYWLSHGALRVNENLGGYFTTPFSTNNETAKDLSIHFAFLGMNNRSRNTLEGTLRVKSELDTRITDIRCGNTPMILSSGDSIFSSNAREDAWSTTQDYQPVFNMLNPLDQEVDPDYIDELKDAQR